MSFVNAFRKTSYAAGIALLLSANSASSQSVLVEGDPPQAFEEFQECEACPEMVVLPLGDFLMGGEPLQPDTPGIPITYGRDEPFGLLQEGPVHRVEIDIPIAIGRYEITFDQWMACVEDGVCRHRPSPGTTRLYYGNYEAIGRNPVRRVSYLDIQEYLEWLNGFAEGDVYRLPTEAEWEYAARAGTTTLFASGNDLSSEEANFWDGESRPDWRNNPELPGQLIPIPVDLLRPNPWGLYHMAGNVREMTMSCYTDRQLGLPSSSAYLEHALESVSCRRVWRGGDFRSTLGFSRPQTRFPSPEPTRGPQSGFRVVREIQQR